MDDELPNKIENLSLPEVEELASSLRINYVHPLTQDQVRGLIDRIKYIKELEENAYALQIDYIPPLTDDQIPDVLDKIKYLTEHDLDIDEFRKTRDETRKKENKTCYEPKTYIGNKDTLLMSDSELVFMPHIQDGKIIYYCFDRFEDIAPILEQKPYPINPLNQKPLTQEQIEFLQKELKNSKYPNIYVDELQEEISIRLKQKKSYEIPVYYDRMHELSNMVRELGFPYKADQILIFGTDLNTSDYNLFLRHQPLKQSIFPELLRDNASAQTLGHILNYIAIQKQKGLEEGNKAIIDIGHAIDDFVYMVKHNLTYAELVEQKGEVYVGGGAKEVLWKPNFIKEIYYPGGEIKARFYTNEQNQSHGLYEFWFVDGSLNIKGWYENNLKTGIWSEYYQDGSLEKQGEYKNDHRIGIWFEFYENGNLFFKTIYDDQGRKETESTFNEDGSLYKTSLYYQGKKTGKWITWWPNGLQKTQQEYIDGQKTGTWIQWYDNGSISQRSNYIDDKLDGVVESWHNNGNIKASTSYTKGVKNGPEKEWYLNGQPAVDGFYVNGDKTGFWSTWYKNGNVRTKTRYDKNMKNGVEQVYRKNGTLRAEDSFKNNKRDGIIKMWYNDGSTLHRVVEVNEQGVPNGLSVSYYENGHKKIEGIYQPDVPNPLSKVWAPDGTFLGEREQYQNDTDWYFLDEECYKDGPYISYYPGSSNIYQLGFFVNGIRQGLWKTFYEDGNISAETFYNETDLIHDTFTVWYNNGVKSYTENYLDDIPDGEFHYYYNNGQLAAHGIYDHGSSNTPWEVYTVTGEYIGLRTIHQSSDQQLAYFTLDDHKDGPYMLFTNKDQLISSGIYINDQKTGPWIEIENNIRYTGIYNQGKKEGPWEKYDLEEELAETIIFKDGILLHFWQAQQLNNLLSEVKLHLHQKIIEFAANLNWSNYTLFLKYKALNASLTINISRNKAASDTLDYILDFIRKREAVNEDEGYIAKISIGHAINEFMYMIETKTTYQDLIEEKGVIYSGHVKELYWKPIFVRENYYPSNALKERYYINNEGNRYGPYTSWYENGILSEKRFYENGMVNGIWSEYDENGLLQSKGIYFNDEHVAD